MSHEEGSSCFSAWLRAQMEAQHWTQAELARASYLSRAVICKLLARKTSPKPVTLAALAHAFKLPIEVVYREARLLPETPPAEIFLKEATHLLERIRNPQRKITALHLIRALVEEENGTPSG